MNEEPFWSERQIQELKDAGIDIVDAVVARSDKSYFVISTEKALTQLLLRLAGQRLRRVREIALQLRDVEMSILNPDGFVRDCPEDKFQLRAALMEELDLLVPKQP